MDNIFPQITTDAAKGAAEHFSRMKQMLENWYDRSGAQWTPGMIVNPELSARFDTFVPWQQVSRSLRAVARRFLPSEEWIPQMLLDGALDSVLEFWQELPEYQGKAAPDPDELLNFFCACADPPRYGTNAGRYPHQLEMLKKLTAPKRLLDLGCGIGLGTMETTDALKPESACGVTIEPLEAWMAAQRWLPHDPERSQNFRQWMHLKNITFHAADITEYRGDVQYDLIICNGLAGGRFLHSEKHIQKFLDCIDANTSPTCIMAAANSFHHGHKDNVEFFLKKAAERNWQVTGTWQNAILMRENRQ